MQGIINNLVTPITKNLHFTKIESSSRAIGTVCIILLHAVQATTSSKSTTSPQ